MKTKRAEQRRLLKKKARPTDQSRARHANSKAIVARDRMRGRIAAMEATEEGRRALFGWMAAIGLCALLAFILVDMALGGAA